MALPVMLRHAGSMQSTITASLANYPHSRIAAATAAAAQSGFCLAAREQDSRLPRHYVVATADSESRHRTRIIGHMEISRGGAVNPELSFARMRRPSPSERTGPEANAKGQSLGARRGDRSRLNSRSNDERLTAAKMNKRNDARRSSKARSFKLRHPRCKQVCCKRVVPRSPSLVRMPK